MTLQQHVPGWHHTPPKGEGPLNYTSTPLSIATKQRCAAQIALPKVQMLRMQNSSEFYLLNKVPGTQKPALA